MTLPEIRELLAVLREGGVRSCTLDATGAPVSLEFHPPEPPAPESRPRVVQDDPQTAALQALVDLAGRKLE